MVPLNSDNLQTLRGDAEKVDVSASEEDNIETNLLMPYAHTSGTRAAYQQARYVVHIHSAAQLSVDPSLLANLRKTFAGIEEAGMASQQTFVTVDYAGYSVCFLTQ